VPKPKKTERKPTETREQWYERLRKPKKTDEIYPCLIMKYWVDEDGVKWCRVVQRDGIAVTEKPRKMKLPPTVVRLNDAETEED
jgi:hypothetical protein